MNKKKKQTKVKSTEPSIDKSPVIHQRSKMLTPVNIVSRPLNDKQTEFLNVALNKDTKMVIVSGVAGTSKTFLSVLSSLYLLNQKKISDILYIRSVVESADSKMGYLPGESADKFAPYLQPLEDKLEEFLTMDEIKTLKKDGRIKGLPVGFLRGRNFNALGIIVDEAQNMTTKELLTIMTRTGEFSRVFIIGDPMQSDINGKSGFKKVFDLFNDEDSKKNGIHTFEFGEEDIVRSGLVRFLINKFKKLE